MASYTRQDVGNNIENDEIADATYLDQEFDALAAAFIGCSFVIVVFNYRQVCSP